MQIKITPLNEHKDFFLKDERGDNYIAEICRITSYTEVIKTDTIMNHETCRFDHLSYLVRDYYKEHYIASLDDKAIVLYKKQKSDCCRAKEGNICICVAYTRESERGKGYITQILKRVQNRFKKRELVVDTYTKELISVSKKLGIKSFKGNF